MWAKAKKMHQRQKRMKKTGGHPKNSWGLQRNTKLSFVIKSAKKRVLITKIKKEKKEIITSRRWIANVFGEFYNNLYDDNEHDESEQEIGENEHKSSTDVHINSTDEMTRIPEITTEELRTAINKLKKKANLQTATESEPKTSKHVMARREKWWDKSWTKL